MIGAGLVYARAAEVMSDAFKSGFERWGLTAPDKKQAYKQPATCHSQFLSHFIISPNGLTCKVIAGRRGRGQGLLLI